MKNKKKLLPMLVLAGGIILGGGALHAQRPRISVGIGIGGPPPAVAYVPASPGPGDYWVRRYWNGGVWVRGYWAPPAYYGGFYGHGHWDHGRVDHRGHRR